MLRKQILHAFGSAAVVMLATTQIPTPVYATAPGVLATYTADADFAQGILVNVNYTDVPDQLQLNSEAKPFNFIYVAVSSKGTVVKINTDTGEILGEYRTAPEGMGLDPSRTTVDSNGSAWVTNRAESSWVLANAVAPGVPPVDRQMGSVTQIGLKENGQCVDRNNNGVIDTSTGLNDIRVWTNSGGADTLGGVSTAEDECILHYVRVNSTGARHVSVDANNDVWVSGTVGQYFDLIDSSTGSITRQEQPVGYGGYGGLIDRNGVIWSARPLLRWDTALLLTGPNGDPAGPDIGPPASGTNWAGQTDYDSYGLCINPKNGEVWNTEYATSTGYINRYAPDGKHLGGYPQGNNYAQGCVVDNNGHVWVAHSLTGPSNTVGHLDADGNFLGSVTVGSGPTGVAVDGNGKIWATNYWDQTVSRIDPALNGGIGQVDLTTVNLGGNLYNYSDMTGSTLINPPNTGTWTVEHDTLEDPDRLKISWTADTPSNSSLEVKIACSSDGETFRPELPVTNGVSNDVKDCRYVKVIVSFTRASAGTNPILYDLTIDSRWVSPPHPPLVATQWYLISLPLDVSNDNNTVKENIFGDDLHLNDYETSWGLYAWNAGNEQYDWIKSEDPLVEGKGYWLMTLDSGKNIEVMGIPNPAPPNMDVDLVGNSAGRLNMVGYPYVTNGCWANAKVIDGGQEIPLRNADPAGTCWTTPAPNCVLSRIMFKWNGADYDSYDGLTTQAEGTLSAFDGLWVKAFKPGIKLRLPNTCTKSSAKLAAATPSAAWWLRLIVASDNLRDAGNLLGRLSDSRNGYDAHDLPALAPAVSPHLSLVFPRLDRGAQSGDYTTDYRQAGRQFQGGAWDFEVRSDIARTITLLAEGSQGALARSSLFDSETGRWLKPDKKGRYTVKMVGPVHRLRWSVK